MGRVSAEKRRAAVERLSRLREDEALTAAHVRTVADGLGVSERTVWRWLVPPKPAAPAARPRYELSETDRDALAFYRGNVAAVVRARRAVTDGDGTTAGAPVPDFLAQGWATARSVPERTLYRAFTTDLNPAERAAWKSGEAGRRAGSVYLRRPDALRGRVWEMDHKQLLVLPPKGKALAPWLTTVVDDGTRALLGWAIAVTPTSGTVLTAMRMALTYEPDVSPFGAVPELVRIDRGLEFAAGAVKEVLGGLAVVMHRLPAFHPHRKGKVERLNLTIEQMLISQLPGFTGGPRDAGGKLYGPIKDSVAAQHAAESAAEGDGPLRLERFVKRFADWARWYNTAHRHRMLGGRTPLTAWEEDPAPLRRVPTEQLRHLMLAGATRIVQKDGINFHGLAYVVPELYGRGGQRVQIRYMPHDDRTIEVYLGAEHLCTAYPTGQLTPAQTDAFRAHARAEAERLGKERRRASRQARRTLAPMTGDSVPAESRLVPAADGALRTQRDRDRALAARASTSLLGLIDPTAPADPES